jgi:hypothetical protein
MGDPVNWADPNGLDKCPPQSENTCVEVIATPDPIALDWWGDWYRSDISPNNGGGSLFFFGPIGNKKDILDEVRDKRIKLIQGLEAQGCSFNEHLTLECEDAAVLAAAVAGRAGAIGTAAVVWARWVGTAGERAVGGLLNLPKNTVLLRNTLSGTDRIPDFWRGNTITR